MRDLESLRLHEWIAVRRTALLERWLPEVLSFLPEPTVKLFRRDGDPFQNPVGSVLREGLGRVLIWMARPERRREDLEEPLQRMAAVLAVQSGPPSRHLRFILIFDDLLKEEARREGVTLTPEEEGELSAIQHSLIEAFLDAYVEQRDKIGTLRGREMERFSQQERLVRRTRPAAVFAGEEEQE